MAVGKKQKNHNSQRQIIEEKADNLRGRHFVKPREAKPNIIVSRLNRRADSSISTITLAKTKR